MEKHFYDIGIWLLVAVMIICAVIPLGVLYRIIDKNPEDGHSGLAQLMAIYVIIWSSAMSWLYWEFGGTITFGYFMRYLFLFCALLWTFTLIRKLQLPYRP